MPLIYIYIYFIFSKNDEDKSKLAVKRIRRLIRVGIWVSSGGHRENFKTKSGIRTKCDERKAGRN